MSAIIAGHFRFQNGITGGYLFNVLTSAPNIAVNLFLLIGTWFMVDRPFRPEHPIKIHATLIFYGWLITVMVAATGGVCLQYILQGAFPFFGCALWFATAYICLQCLSPYLTHVNLLQQKSAVFLCLIVPTTFSLVASTPWGDECGLLGGTLWFVCVYLIMSFLKLRTDFFITANPLLYLSGSIILYSIMVASLSFTQADSMVYIAAAHCRSTIQSLPNFLVALGLFIGFRSIRRSCPRVIQSVSASTFGIYVIHQMPCFMSPQWKLVKDCLPFPMDSELHIVLDICFVVITLFAFYVPIDRLRAHFVEPRLIHCSPYNYLKSRLNSIVST